MTLVLSPGHLNSKQLPLEASFSPDSQFVISGSSDGRIHIWNSENGQKVCVLNGDHKNPVQCVQVCCQDGLSGPGNNFIHNFSSTRSTWWWLLRAVWCPSGSRPLRRNNSKSTRVSQTSPAEKLKFIKLIKSIRVIITGLPQIFLHSCLSLILYLSLSGLTINKSWNIFPT